MGLVADMFLVLFFLINVNDFFKRFNTFFKVGYLLRDLVAGVMSAESVPVRK